ncbi:TPA: hypothetical protein DCZ32_03745, partial [Candidatus Uhrbacteria bacterium]|nr:hypothetical protein [Candidatus Uhrbacteria bacterium]
AKVKKGDAIIEMADGEKVLSDFDGTVKAAKTKVAVVYEASKIREYIIPPGYSLHVKDGDEVAAGDELTEGHIDLQTLYEYKGREAVQLYMLKEIQYIY